MMAFLKLVEETESELHASGVYNPDAMQTTVLDILLGYCDHNEALEDAKFMILRNDVKFTIMGVPFSGYDVQIAVELDHKQQLRASRQACCCRCHACGTELQTVLDGELWCSNCEMYR